MHLKTKDMLSKKETSYMRFVLIFYILQQRAVGKAALHCPPPRRGGGKKNKESKFCPLGSNFFSSFARRSFGAAGLAPKERQNGRPSGATTCSLCQAFCRALPACCLFFRPLGHFLARRGGCCPPGAANKAEKHQRKKQKTIMARSL